MSDSPNHDNPTSDLLERRLRDLFAADAEAAPQPADLLTTTLRAASSRSTGRAERAGRLRSAERAEGAGRLRSAGGAAGAGWLRSGAWAVAAGVVAIAAAVAVFRPAPEPVPFPHVAAPAVDPVRGPADPAATPGYGPGTTLSMRPAAQVLGAAADTAARLPDVLPKPGQFLYVRSVGRDGRVNNERWYSIDGAHDGFGFNREEDTMARLLFPGCRDGRYISGEERGGRCEPSPAYLPDLPTDPDAMAAYIDRANAHLNDDPSVNKTNGMGKEVWHLANSYYLRPAQRAALYRAAARLDGLTVVDGAVDAAGRKGTGVSWTFSGYTAMLIFDPVTHAYLGSGEETTTAAIVDEVGQRE